MKLFLLFGRDGLFLKMVKEIINPPLLIKVDTVEAARWLLPLVAVFVQVGVEVFQELLIGFCKCFLLPAEYGFGGIAVEGALVKAVECADGSAGCFGFPEGHRLLGVCDSGNENKQESEKQGFHRAWF